MSSRPASAREWDLVSKNKMLLVFGCPLLFLGNLLVWFHWISCLCFIFTFTFIFMPCLSRQLVLLLGFVCWCFLLLSIAHCPTLVRFWIDFLTSSISLYKVTDLSKEKNMALKSFFGIYSVSYEFHCGGTVSLRKCCHHLLSLLVFTFCCCYDLHIC